MGEAWLEPIVPVAFAIGVLLPIGTINLPPGAAVASGEYRGSAAMRPGGQAG